MLLWLLFWMYLRGNKLWLRKLLLEIILNALDKRCSSVTIGHSVLGTVSKEHSLYLKQ